MLARVLQIGVLIMVALGSGSVGAATVRLAWSWTEGDSTRYRVRETAEQAVDGPAGAWTLAWDRTIELTRTVFAVDENGTATVEQITESVRAEVDHSERGRATLDSSSGRVTGAEALVAPFREMVGARVLFTVSAEGRVEVLESQGHPGIGAALAGLGDEARALAQALGQADDTAAVARQIESSLRMIPGRRVERGDDWNVQVRQPALVGEMITTTDWSFAGVRRDGGAALARLVGTGTLAFAAGGLEGLLGIELVRGELRTEVLFDLERGQLDTHRATLETEWTVDASGGLGDTAGRTRQTMTQTATWERVG